MVIKNIIKLTKHIFRNKILILNKHTQKSVAWQRGFTRAGKKGRRIRKKSRDRKRKKKVSVRVCYYY